MRQKSKFGQTNKYTDLVSNVNNSNKKEQKEPTITEEQVINAFTSFGFDPKENNLDEISYWTTKPQSEIPKLIEELRKKRIRMNSEQEQEKKNQFRKDRAIEDTLRKQKEERKALPRLSDEELFALFDEYGLPLPDVEWARNHLPNDPKKIRAILEMQRKTTDDMIKKESKNAINKIPETPKNQFAQSMPTARDGQGGPTQTQTTPFNEQTNMNEEAGPKTPFFIGDHSIVKITNPSNPNASTTWLVDTKKKILRPFESEEAFGNAFDDPASAEKAVVTISAKELEPGGALEGFKLLKGEQGIMNDGSMEQIPFTEGQIQQRYGKEEDPVAENKALLMIDGLLGKLKSKGSPNPQI